MTYIAGTATAFPSHYCSQEELTSALLAVWSTERNSRSLERINNFHKNLMVDGRYLALPLEAYTELSGFGARNQAWIEVAADLGAATLNALLEQAELDPQDVSQLTSTTVTGIATPSIDALLMNRIPFSPHLKRMPLFGLGFLAGVSGIARASGRGGNSAVYRTLLSDNTT